MRLLRRPVRVVDALLLFGVALQSTACGEDATASAPSEEETRKSDEAAPPESPATDNAEAAEAPFTEREPSIGTFAVQLTPPGDQIPEGGTSFTGAINDGPSIPGIPFVLLETAGACALYGVVVPECSSDCGAGSCVAEDRCQMPPLPISAGEVTVTGLELDSGESNFSVKSIGATKRYTPSGSVDLSYPVVAGQEVAVSAAGGDVEAFTVATTTVAQLVFLGPEQIPFESGKDMTVTWEEAEVPSLSQVTIDIDISHHGGAKGAVVCEVPDVGQYTVPADLVTKLMALGVAGFPTVDLTRVSRGSVETELGRVDLEAKSRIQKLLDIPGLISCGEDGSVCPEGQVCAITRSCVPE